MLTVILRSKSQGSAMNIVLTMSIQIVGLVIRAEVTETAPHWLLTNSTGLAQTSPRAAHPPKRGVISK
jgi:hypothetical protein